MTTIAVKYEAFKPDPKQQATLAPFQRLVYQLARKLYGSAGGTLRYGEIQLALLSLLGRQADDDKPFTVALAGVMGAVAYEVNSLLTVPPSMRPSGEKLRASLAEITGRNIGLASIWLDGQGRRVRISRKRPRYDYAARLLKAYNRLHPERLDITTLDVGTSFSLRTGDGGTIVATVRNPAQGLVDLWLAADFLSRGIPSRVGSRTPGEDEATWDIAQQGDELAMLSFSNGRSSLTHSIIMLIQMA